MNLKTLSMMGALLLLAGTGANAQKKKEVLNDSNTPLHLLQPAYKVPYGMLTTEEIKADMDRVLRYLEKNTPTRVVDKNTGKVITDYANMTADAQLERGAFRLASYEWGVTYSAMLAAAEATGDQAYYKYVTDRFQFLAEVAPHFRKVLEKYGTVDPQMKQILTPHALDDAGAVCAAMVKVQMKENSPELKPLIDNYMDFIVNKEYRLADGTFARTRPQHNTLWLDDMFMGIPPVAWYSCIAGDKKQMYLSEAVRQIFQFADRMWVPGKNLFRHGWVEGMQDHPAFHWGRANGWALLTMCEVLDVLPEDYPQRDKYWSCSVLMYVVLLPARVVKVSGISCWIVTILIWKPRPRLFMYIALPMLSIKDGLMLWHTVRWHSWDGMPLPPKSMRKVRWMELV